MRAVVPLKEFSRAKQRLSGLLNSDERRGLARAMVQDVLAALRATREVDGILLVSREPEAAALAGAFGAELFREPRRADLSEAVQAAGGYLVAQHRVTGTMIVPADVPLAMPGDFRAVLEGHQQLTLVPDAGSDGTNCIVSSPPNLIRYQFDGHSFRPHVEAAYAIGTTPRICQRRNLELDIDTPTDLARLLMLECSAGQAAETAAYIARHGLAERIATFAAPAPLLGTAIATDS
jgi:2-phospho-L-lactate/phosphoenolpyruvate guanylyltransferase